MAINPPLNRNFEPLRVANEHFILMRNNIDFEVIIENLGRVTGAGKCLLSSSRLVLINTEIGAALKAFDVPLALIYDE